jgi:hypothetical protein
MLMSSLQSCTNARQPAEPPHVSQVVVFFLMTTITLHSSILHDLVGQYGSKNLIFGTVCNVYFFQFEHLNLIKLIKRSVWDYYTFC